MGALAGIGGLALGVFLILFRDFIRGILARLPGITRGQAYQLLILFLILVWSIAVIGIGAWVILELQSKSILPTPLVPTPIPVPAASSTPTPETVTVNYTVCLGEYERSCGFVHDVYLYCGGAAEAEAYFKDKCLRVDAKQIAAHGGNKCGYSNVSVICVRAKP